MKKTLTGNAAHVVANALHQERLRNRQEPSRRYHFSDELNSRVMFGMQPPPADLHFDGTMTLVQTHRTYQQRHPMTLKPTFIRWLKWLEDDGRFPAFSIEVAEREKPIPRHLIKQYIAYMVSAGDMQEMYPYYHVTEQGKEEARRTYIAFAKHRTQ